MPSLRVTGFFVAFFVLVAQTSLGRPSARPQTSNRKIPKYLKELHEKIINGTYKLAPGVKAIHGVFAHAKRTHGAARRQKRIVDLVANFSGIPALKKVVKANLHVFIKSRARIRTSGMTAVCRVDVIDLKSSGVVKTVKIPCYRRSGEEVLTLTSIVNKWLKRPKTNLGVRVKISAQTPNVTQAAIPTVNRSNRVKQAYFILFSK